MQIVVENSGIAPEDILAIGIANQRETTVVWDRRTGEPVYNAIVWQCRRTAPLVDELVQAGLSDIIRSKTGLLPDAYFSGTKLRWILDNVEGARQRAANGELCFGTIDTYLAYLSCQQVHVTDATNACRTLLFNLREQRWDPELLEMLDIPDAVLPQVVDSAQVVGTLRKDILGAEIPIAAMAGDQHAALFGQACFTPGMTKNTYGTGCFMLMNTGSSPVASQNGLLTTMAWRLDGVPTYALEGSVFIGGAVVQWLRDEMHLIEKASDTEAIANSVSDNGGVYLVPAFTGLGAPHWDMYARGTIVGLTRGTGRAHIIRAALESIALQSRDVLEAMSLDSGLKPDACRWTAALPPTISDAVPGRCGGSPGGSPQGDRDHCLGRCHAGGLCRGPLGPGSAGQIVDDGLQLHACHGVQDPDGAAGELEAGGGSSHRVGQVEREESKEKGLQRSAAHLLAYTCIRRPREQGRG